MSIESKEINIQDANYPKVINLILNKEGVYIAGGAVRSFLNKRFTICDFDIFFDSRESYEFVKNLMSVLADEYGIKKIFTCPEDKLHSYAVDSYPDKNLLRPFEEPNVYSGHKIQLIAPTFYLNVEALLESFDFTICCFAIHRKDKKFYLSYDEKHKVHLDNMELVVNKIQYPSASIKRIHKYLEKGFKAQPSFYTNIVNEIQDGRNIVNGNLVYID